MTMLSASSHFSSLFSCRPIIEMKWFRHLGTVPYSEGREPPGARAEQSVMTSRWQVRTMAKVREDSEETTMGSLAEIIERARRALTEHLHPSVVEALAVLEGASVQGATGSTPGRLGGAESIAARLYVDARTNDVFVRIYDVRSGVIMRDVPQTHLAEEITQLPPTIANESD